MVINTTGGIVGGLGATAGVPAAAANDGVARAPAATTGRIGDVAAVGRVQPIGQGGAELSSLARDMAASPPVDAGKVDRLRAAIAGGGYRPDPARIADAMLALAPAPAASVPLAPPTAAA